MTRYTTEVETDTGWTRWIPPERIYQMACCDCGLVHTLEFRVLHDPDPKPGYLSAASAELPWGEHRVQFRARRNMRSTAARRRWRNKA